MWVILTIQCIGYNGIVRKTRIKVPHHWCNVLCRSDKFMEKIAYVQETYRQENYKLMIFVIMIEIKLLEICHGLLTQGPSLYKFCV